MKKLHLAILGSTRGTTLTPLIELIRNEKLPFEITICLSNKKDSGFLGRAEQAGLATQYIPTRQGISREAYDLEVDAELTTYPVDYILLIGYMRILSDFFVEKWVNKILNVHPSLLPDFSRLMDLDVHTAVLAAKKKQTGCTVHIVTPEVDSGPILAQRRCAIVEDDTPLTLKMRVQALEASTFIDALKKLSNS